MDKNKPSAVATEQEKATVRLLVIRLSALGDVAMTVPVLRTAVQRYPQLRLTVVSKPFFKPLFSGIPGVDFYEADVKGRHKGFSGLWKLAAELSALHPRAVADFHNVLRSRILGLFFKLKGIPVVRINKGRKEKKALTRKTAKVLSPLKSTHWRYADVLEQLGFPVELSRHQFPPQKKLTSEMKAITGAGHKKRIGIAPFAAYPGKTYPLDLMEEVIAALNKTNAYNIILFGGGTAETKTLQRIAATYENAVNAAGVYTFEEELALIANLDLMVAMDSGNAHLAAMYGVTTLTLWGVTHPFTGFYPFAQPAENALLADRERYPLIPTSVYGKTCPKSYEAAMRSIPPDRVIKKITACLK